MKKSRQIIIGVIFVYLILAIALFLSFYILEEKNYLAVAILAISIIVSVAIYYYFNIYHKSIASDIEVKLSGSMNDALKQSEVGILMYDENYEITYLSNLFKDKNIDHSGEKILVWLPELQDLLSGKVDKTIVIVNDDKYEVTKKDDDYVLFFNDISTEYDLKKAAEDNEYVFGLVNFDNFDELSLNENDVSFVNTNIKVPVIEYFRKYGIVYKTLRNNCIQLVLNKKIYRKLLDDRFSILNKVRKESKAGGIDVTLSMSFAYGSNNLSELDEEASNLLEIAQTRGGDQVVVRQIGKDASFFGGSSEARERASKVKVRVVASTIKNIISEASEVIIVGHKDADSDCMGAALSMSLIVRQLGKKAYIVTRSGGIEPMIKGVISNYDEALSEHHNFISESEAISLLDDDTLVIMVDHHSKNVTSSPNLISEASKIVVIDHHRRSADLDFEALFMYIEAGASSATELIVELFPYFSRNMEVSKEEANIMYIGLLIDTNHFRNRSDSRTFDVAKMIKQLGANSKECEQLIEEPYDLSKKRYDLIACAKKYRDNILIASKDDDYYPRSIASQAVDSMVEIKEIAAAFVVCKLNKDEVAISARSDGSINVQLIMEKLGGGGHMTAAGLQKKDISVNELYNNLISGIDEYLESVKDDESNIVEWR